MFRNNRSWRFLFAATMLLNSAVVFAGQEGDHLIKLDPLLVIALADVPKEIRNRVITHNPIVARFSKGPYEVDFVAAAHETGPGPTFSLIERCFNRFQLRAVIREGLAYASGPAPRGRAAEIKREGGPHSEADQAVVLALERGLPAYGGEPTEEQKLEAALAHGYSREDFISLEFLSMAGYYVRVGQWKPERAPQVFSEVSAWLEPKANSSRFDYSSFLGLYKERNGRPFDPANESDLLAGPDPQGNHWQRLGHAVDMSRNRFLTEVLSKIVRRHKRVLVVYGNGHLAVQWTALVAAFGQPSYIGELTK